MAENGAMQAARGNMVFAARMDLLLVAAREDLRIAIDFFLQDASVDPIR
jgi:hypothetical protein